MPALALVLAGTAAAHSPARLRVVSPGENARVAGDTLRIHVVGEGGDADAVFRMTLDGQLVDATGKVGGVFTTLTVPPSGQLVLDVPVSLGEHTLVVTPNFDPDAQQETVVRRFSVVPEEQGSPVALVLAGVAILGAVGAAVAVRRKAVAQQPEP